MGRVGLGSGLVQSPLKADRTLDRGFTEDRGERKHQQARNQTGKHPPNEQRPDYAGRAGQWQGKPSR
jgi:hypothetical protein